MTTKEEATAAPTTLRFGKREFKMAPMNDEDMATLNQWIRSRHMQIARQSLAKDATVEERELTERVALDQASKMSFMFGAGISIISTVEGWAQIMWCCVHRNHPGITPQDIEKILVKNPDSLTDLQKEFERINELNDIDVTPTKKKKSARKKKAKRKAAQKSRRKNR